MHYQQHYGVLPILKAIAISRRDYTDTSPWRYISSRLAAVAY